jgi:hypothetical protein
VEEKNDNQAARQQAALKRLDVVVGEWDLEILHPLIPGSTIGGRAAVEWLAGEYFMLYRSRVEHPDFPEVLFVIGYDEESGDFSMHYFDSRGITRLYKMRVDDRVWTIWRDNPDFSQRYTGTFSEDGKTITGAWELSEDGSKWDHDFDLTYRRVE